MRGLIFWQTEEKLEVEEKRILHPNLDDGREWKRIFATSWFIACKSRPKRSISNAVAKQHFYFQWKIHSAFWSAFQSLEIKSWGLEGFFFQFQPFQKISHCSKPRSFVQKFEFCDKIRRYIWIFNSKKHQIFEFFAKNLDFEPKLNLQNIENINFLGKKLKFFIHLPS